jgi:hypothetical protein
VAKGPEPLTMSEVQRRVQRGETVTVQTSETASEAPAAPARATTCVVTGYNCRAAYGPYPRERAEEIVEQLNAGGWMDEFWLAVDVLRLPGEEPPKPVQQYATEDMFEKQALFKVLQRRQPCPRCGSTVDGHTCSEEVYSRGDNQD